MRSSRLFFLGLSIDALLLVITVSSLLMMRAGFSDLSEPQADGLSNLGQLAIWLIPTLLILLMALGWWMRSTGKPLVANILLWIPALPMAVGILLWGGLALLFFVFGG
ncbi:MAG: hypothetical protein R2824_14990 [Saprospiraceae bacterium]|nr:hypothetical protein [Lewinella sp.]